MIVYYNGKASDAQVNWGGNDDPRNFLEVGVPYEVARWEVHTWHTKVHLVDFPGKYFNSVHFHDAEGKAVEIPEEAMDAWLRRRYGPHL